MTRLEAKRDKRPVGFAVVHGRQELEIPAFQRRLDRQAEATRHLRMPVYEHAGLPQAASIVDIGCGSGAVTADLAQWGARVVGVDLDAAMTRRSRDRGHAVLRADGGRLPLPDGCMDAAVCNLTLMWAPDPARLVAEMARVVRPGGVVVASMEPDYGAKVHWPENPLVDAVFNGQGVANRGGDPHAGRKLRDHFVRAGLLVDVGISNARIPSPEEDLQTFRRHRAYYRRMLRENGFGRHDIDAWEEEYLQALESGIETCFLPMFHAIGRHPGGAARQ